MNIIKYIFNKKYRENYTENIIERFSYSFNEYEKIYKNLRKSNSQIKHVENPKQSA